jgi:hypothetical protein
MKPEHIHSDTPRMQRAVAELQALIQEYYPASTFQVTHGEDPIGTYVIATVGVEDTDAVVDVYIDRLLELQTDDGLPVHVIPVRPLNRVTVL